MLKRALSVPASRLARAASTLQRRPIRLTRAQTVLGVSAVSLLAIGAAGLALDQGTHLWLEYHLTRFKAGLDPDTKEWGWDLEAEKWTGDPYQGGTDDALGAQGKKALRNAWFSHHRPLQYGFLDDAGADVDARLLRTDACLEETVAIAEQPDVSPKLHPCTMPDLLTRRAGILERLGPVRLEESRIHYERAWNLLGGTELPAARVAVKLGDVCSRLGHDQALAWYARALQLVGGNNSIVPVVPPSPPPSPAAQRIMASALVSTSAFYAGTGQLSQAQKVQEATLKLLGTIRPPESVASASPPQALHYLTLLHRSAIISSHLAEVIYAQRFPVAECLQRLQASATSSERVAFALVGISTQYSNSMPSAQEPILAQYAENPYLERPANDLLRDARRSAANAWNLMGELTERMGVLHKQIALSYYERALEWSGSLSKPSDSTLRDDWTTIRTNYLRLAPDSAPTR